MEGIGGILVEEVPKQWYQGLAGGVVTRLS